MGRALRWTTTRRVASLTCAALTSFGCATIIGLDDYEKDDDVGAGGSSTGGDGGTGGSAGSGGSAGTGGDGAGGTAGSGGTAGTGGVVGTGGTGGTVGCDGDASFAPNQAVVDTCVLRASCDPANVFSISECVSKNVPISSEREFCTTTAQDCAGIERCTGSRWLSHEECALEAQGYSCQDSPEVSRIVFCSLLLPGVGGFRLDCAPRGGQCFVDDSDPEAPFAECLLPETKQGECTVPEGEYACLEGQNTVYTCHDGVRYGTDCGALQTICLQPAGFDADCYRAGTPCEGTQTRCLDDDTLAECIFGQRTLYDCSSVGLRCENDPRTGFGACVAPGCTTENVSNCQESCDGNVLTFCYGGRPFSIDCASYPEFDTCIESEGDDGSTRTATCFPSTAL